jgi:hypothetical protein
VSRERERTTQADLQSAALKPAWTPGPWTYRMVESAISLVYCQIGPASALEKHKSVAYGEITESKRTFGHIRRAMAALARARGEQASPTTHRQEDI